MLAVNYKKNGNNNRFIKQEYLSIIILTISNLLVQLHIAVFTSLYITDVPIYYVVYEYIVLQLKL